MKNNAIHIILGIGIFSLFVYPAFSQRQGSPRPSVSRSSHAVRSSRSTHRSAPRSVPHSSSRLGSRSVPHSSHPSTRRSDSRSMPRSSYPSTHRSDSRSVPRSSHPSSHRSDFRSVPRSSHPSTRHSEPRSSNRSRHFPHSGKPGSSRIRSSFPKSEPSRHNSRGKLPEKVDKSITVRRPESHHIPKPAIPRHAFPRESVEDNIRIRHPRDYDSYHRHHRHHFRPHRRYYWDGLFLGWGIHFTDDDFSVSLRSGYNWDYHWDDAFYVYEADPWIYWNASYYSDYLGISLCSGYPSYPDSYQVWVSGYWDTVYENVKCRDSFGRVYWRTVSRKVWVPGYWKTCYR